MHVESHENQPLMTWVWICGLATKGACTARHGLDGPGTQEVQACHKDQAGATAGLARKVKTGGRTSESRCRRAEQRRNASKSGLGAAFLGALVAAGIIKPGMALADWNKAAFETKNPPHTRSGMAIPGKRIAATANVLARNRHRSHIGWPCRLVQMPNRALCRRSIKLSTSE